MGVFSTFVVLFCSCLGGRWFNHLIVLLYSFWVPQIISNAVRGSRYPLHKWYLLGTSASRLVLPLYLYACPNSFMSVIDKEWRPQYQVRHTHRPFMVLYVREIVSCSRTSSTTRGIRVC